MISDVYRTIAVESTAEFRTRGSKFLAYAISITEPAQLDTLVKSLRKAHPKACHVCRAYIIRKEHELVYKSSDDGEPNGSAGIPILNAIKRAELSQIGVAVVRYFGGTKLGIPGLIEAYGGAATLAIEQARIISITPKSRFQISYDYAIMGRLLSVIKELDLTIVTHNMDANPFLTLDIDKSDEDRVIRQLKIEVLQLPKDYQGVIAPSESLKIVKLSDA